MSQHRMFAGGVKVPALTISGIITLYLRKDELLLVKRTVDFWCLREKEWSGRFVVNRHLLLRRERKRRREGSGQTGALH